MNAIARSISGLLFAISCIGPATAADAAPKLAPGEFARVGDVSIPAQEFDNAFREAGRQKFYHGKPPEGAIEAMRRDVGDQLINRVLLQNEARRRGIEPDPKKIEATVAGYDRQYGASEQWKQNREKMLPPVIQYLENESRVEQLEQQVRSVPAPTEEDARAFYQQRPDLFTEPEQVRVSLILLRVDPSSGGGAWEKADEEAKGIVTRIRGGAEFGELAKVHSKDASSAQGGDLGYLHRGMLPEAAQEAVDKLKPGEVSEPIMVMEGIAIVRLDDRKLARARAFDDVKGRAADLLRRERADRQWKEFIAALRSTVPITIDESRYPPVAASQQK